MRITEKQRTTKAFELIEEAMADAGCKTLREAFVYRMAHAARAKGCRKNHPGWLEELDGAIRDEKKARAKR
jgi:hypothetical protein